MTSLNIERNDESGLEGTSTLELARELHRSAIKNNVGRTIYDAISFDTLGDMGRFHLLDIAAVGERFLMEFPDESGQLLIWNLARTIFEAYYSHPVDSTPNLGWEKAPNDLKLLWYRYAEDFLRIWYSVKGLPRYPGWLQVKVDR